MTSAKTGRNDPCPCGSGKKYKKCCARKVEQPPTGLKAAVRMKGGVAFDSAQSVYRAIVHSWDNPDCMGQPEQWESEQGFQSEEAAMSFYRKQVRPRLERLMRQAGREEGVKVASRRLEE
jgi:hypothetical protein